MILLVYDIINWLTDYQGWTDNRYRYRYWYLANIGGFSKFCTDTDILMLQKNLEYLGKGC